MNERIKELNLQAMSIVMNGNDPDGDIEQMYIPLEFTKKFAELIVRECITTIEQDRFQKANDLDTEYDDGYVDGMGRAERILEEHFGVEE